MRKYTLFDAPLAVAAGDQNVYFINGESFYGETDCSLCSVDGCHPNDIGFYHMACVIRPVLKKMLGCAAYPAAAPK